MIEPYPNKKKLDKIYNPKANEKDSKSELTKESKKSKKEKKSKGKKKNKDKKKKKKGLKKFDAFLCAIICL